MSEELLKRLEAVSLRLAPGGGDSGDSTPPTVQAYDTFYSDNVSGFVDAINKFAELKDIAESVTQAWSHLRQVMEAATVCAQPEGEAFMKFLDPIVQVITGTQGKIPKPSDPFFNHWQAFNETVQSLNWIMMPGPSDFITGQLESSSMYLNRILMKAKDMEDEPKANHRAFVAGLKKLLTAQAEYAKDFHKSGIVWKFKGQPIGDFKAGEKPAASGESKMTTDDRLEAVCLQLEAYCAKMLGGDGDGPPPSVKQWQEFLADKIAAFVTACNAFEETKQIGKWAETAFGHTGLVIESALSCANPGDDFMKFVTPIVEVIQNSGNTPPTKDPFFAHHKSFNEAVQGLSWIMMPGPKDFIQSQYDGSLMYLNKILMKAKDMDDDNKKAHRLFVSTLKDVMTAQMEYVVDFHKSGIIWKHGGDSVLEFKSAY